MKFIYTVIFLLSAFSVLTVPATDSTTEASSNMMKNKLDFCCERDKTDESAQDMSEQEADQIVKLFFPDTIDIVPTPRPKGKGQR